MFIFSYHQKSTKIAATIAYCKRHYNYEFKIEVEIKIKIKIKNKLKI